MDVAYEVNGYNRKTGELAITVDVPDWRVSSVLRTARVPMSDDGLGSYPLNDGQVMEITSLLGNQINRPDLEFFLEPYEAPQQAAG